MKRRGDKQTKTKSWFVNTQGLFTTTPLCRSQEERNRIWSGSTCLARQGEERENRHRPWSIFLVFCYFNTCLLAGSVFTALQWVCDPFRIPSPNGAVIFGRLHIGVSSVQLPSLHRCVSSPTGSFPLFFYQASTPFTAFSFEFIPANRNLLSICCRSISLFHPDVLIILQLYFKEWRFY